MADYVDANFNDLLTAINALDAGNLASGTVALARISGLTSTQMAAAFFKDEDDMASDSATAVSSQQALKAFIDARVGDSYCLVDVNGTSVKVYTKYLTGTLDADSSTSVAHGVTVANILSVSASCYDDHADYLRYLVYEIWEASATDHSFTLSYDTTNIIISSVGSYLQGNAYRIRIDYTA